MLFRSKFQMQTSLSPSVCRAFLGCQIEEIVDELNLSKKIISCHPSSLPLPDHVDCFVALNRSPSRLEFSEALLGVHATFDGSMILFQNVVQVLHGSVSTAVAQRPFLLTVRDRGAINRCQVGVDRNFRFGSQQPHTIHPFRESSAPFSLWGWPPGSAQGPHGPTQVPKLLTTAFPSGFVRHSSLRCWSGSIFRLPQPRLSRRKRQIGYPPEHIAKQPFRQMALRQQEPVVAGMFHQPSARLHQSLLQARERPVLDSLW